MYVVTTRDDGVLAIFDDSALAGECARVSGGSVGEFPLNDVRVPPDCWMWFIRMARTGGVLAARKILVDRALALTTDRFYWDVGDLCLYVWAKDQAAAITSCNTKRIELLQKDEWPDR